MDEEANSERKINSFKNSITVVTIFITTGTMQGTGVCSGNPAVNKTDVVSCPESLS